MSRPLRLDLPGALYHVTARGNAREAIYRDDHDRAAFLDLLGETCARYGWKCQAYCLMTNHYHLLLALNESPAGTLVRGMQHLNSHSAQQFNRRHRRVGHVYQGRYRAILVQRERHLFELMRYVVLNPVRAGMVANTGDWPWSSYRATAGLAAAPPWLDVSAATGAFGVGDAGCRAYAAFVAAGVSARSYWDRLSDQIYLGDQAFITRAREAAGPLPRDHEIPAAQRGAPARCTTGAMLTRHQRDAAIVAAFESRDCSMKALAAEYGLHFSQISRIVRRRSGSTTPP